MATEFDQFPLATESFEQFPIADSFEQFPVVEASAAAQTPADPTDISLDYGVLVGERDGRAVAMVGTKEVPVEQLFPSTAARGYGEITPDALRVAAASVLDVRRQQGERFAQRVHPAQFASPTQVEDPNTAELSRLENARNVFARSALSSTLAPAQALSLADEVIFEGGAHRPELRELAKGRSEMFRGTQEDIKYAYPTDPRYKGEFLAETLPQAAGSVIPFTLTGTAGGAGLSSLTGALMTAAQEYDAAKAAGADEATSRKAALVGLPIGMTEGLGALGKGVQNVPGGFSGFLRSIASENIQELSQTGLQTLNASYLSGYDPSRRVTGREALDTILATTVLTGGMTAPGAYANRNVDPNAKPGEVMEETAPDLNSIAAVLEEPDQPDLTGLGSQARETALPTPTPEPPPPITLAQQASANLLGTDATELRQQEAIVTGQPVVIPPEEVIAEPEPEVLPEPAPEEATEVAPEPIADEIVAEEGTDTTLAPEGLVRLESDTFERLADEPVQEGFVAFQDPETNDVFQVPASATPEQVQEARAAAREQSQMAELQFLREENARKFEEARAEQDTLQSLVGQDPVLRKNVTSGEAVREIWDVPSNLKFQLERQEVNLKRAQAGTLKDSDGKLVPPAALEKGVQMLRERYEELTAKVAPAKEAAKGMKRGKKTEGSTQIPQAIVELGESLYRQGVEFKDWSRAMLRNLGEKVRPILKQIWDGIVGSVNALSPAQRRRVEGRMQRSAPAPEGGAVGSQGGRRGTPPATPAEETASPEGRAESISNESSAKTRSDLGLDPRLAPIRRSDPEVWEQAMAILRETPEAASNLVHSLQQRNRATEDWEGMILLIRKIQLLKQEDAAFDKIAASQTEAQVEFANEELDRVQADLAALTLVMENTGTATARGLRIRQRFMEDDFSLARMVKMKRKSLNNGGELNPDQAEEVARLHKELQDAHNATKAAEARANDAEAQLTFKNLIREFKAERAESMAASAKAGKSLTDIFIERGDAASARLKERLKKVNNLIPDPAIFLDVAEIGLGYIAKGVKTVSEFTERLVSEYGEEIRPYAEQGWEMAQAMKNGDERRFGPKTEPAPADILKDAPTELDPKTVFDLARAYVRQGMTGMEQVMERIHQDLLPIIPELTLREVRDAFSGYGKVTYPSKAEDLVKLREMRVLARLTSQLEDVQRRVAPLRTGPQRDAMTAEARILQKQISDLMRKYDLRSSDPLQQLKTSREAVKTRLRNEIEELEQAIQTRTPRPANRTPVEYDAETKALQERRNQIRARYEELFPRAAMTPEQRIAATMKALDKAIAEESQMLRDGILQRPKKAPGVSTPAIENKQMELDALRQLRRELFAATQPRKAPEDIALEQAMKAAQASIDRMDQMLKTGNLDPAKRDPRFTPTNELEALWSERDAMRDALAELRRAQKSRTDPEERARKQTVKMLEKSIKDLDRRITTGDFSTTPRKATRPDVKEVSDLRDLRDQMRKTFNDLKKAQTPPKDPEQVRLERTKKMIKGRIKKLQDKIAAGDYTLAVKREPARDDETRKLKFEEHKLKEKFLEGVFNEQLRNRGPIKKAYDTALETAATVRSVMASSELSGVMRQGGFLVGAHPIRSVAALKDMVKAIKSERGYYETQEDIKNEPDYQNGKFQAAGLYIAEDAPASLQKTEELYMSRWVNQMKGLKGAAFGSVAGAIQGARSGGFLGLLTGSTYMGAVGGAVIGGTVGAVGWTPASQRAYIAFLNRLRVDNFKALEATLTTTGKATDKEAKVLANFVNVATGRGTLGFQTLERSVQGLNALFFAPKYVASRFQLLLLQPLWRGNARTRKLIALEYARYLAGTTTVMLLLAGLKDEDDKETEWNLTSPDFLKIIWNNVRLDAGTGLLQNINFISRMISGEMKNAKGRVYDLTNPKGPYDPDRLTVAARFFRSKAAPIPGVAMDWAAGENVVGEKFTWRTALERSAAPMSASEIEDAAMDLGMPRGAIAAAAIFFGIGANTHDKRAKTSKATKTDFGPTMK